MRVFFSESDYEIYRRHLARLACRHGLEIWAYCLMPNHVHLVALPSCASGLSRPIGEAHRRYAEAINRRQGWTGHLWQERFGSCPMDEVHTLLAVRYVLLNPVRAGLVRQPQEWRFSSASVHLYHRQDPLTSPAPLADRIADWETFLAAPESQTRLEVIRKHSRTGSPLGDSAFVKSVERRVGRRLQRRQDRLLDMLS